MGEISIRINKLKNEKNIFKFIINIYEIMKNKDFSKQKYEYDRFIRNNNDNDLTRILDYINLNEVLNCSSIINMWIDYTENNIEYIYGICWRTLEIIDEYILNIIHNGTEIVKIQCPLYEYKNYIISAKDVPTRFYKNLEKNVIINGKTIVSYDTNSINHYLKNIEIIPISDFKNYHIDIRKYKNAFLGLNTIKIATAPFSKDKWFECKMTDSIFSIEYTKDTSKAMFELLENMEENGINIAVFPELSASDEVYTDIYNYLNQKNYKNIKLIVAGSNYKNRINKLQVFSIDGTLLIEYHKQKSSTKYEKKTHKERCEDLDQNHKIALLDISGFGRIAFPICFDMLSEEITGLMFSRLQSNYMISPIFSTKTGTMNNVQESLAKNKYVTSILCNSCAAVEKKSNQISSINIPKYINEEVINYIECKKWQQECKENCNKCYQIYTIDILQ